MTPQHLLGYSHPIPSPTPDMFFGQGKVLKFSAVTVALRKEIDGYQSSTIKHLLDKRGTQIARMGSVFLHSLIMPSGLL